MNMPSAKMKSLLALATTVSLFASHAVAATITVSSTAGAVSTAPLTAGTTYLFTATGTYGYGPGWADAEFSQNGAGITEIYPGLGLTYATDLLDLTVGGVAVDWLGYNGSVWAPHTYSPTHQYQYSLVGTGAPVTLQIADWQPLLPQNFLGDNSGSLQVTVASLPDGGTTVGMLGLGLAALGALRRKLSV